MTALLAAVVCIPFSLLQIAVFVYRRQREGKALATAVKARFAIAHPVVAVGGFAGLMEVLGISYQVSLMLSLALLFAATDIAIVAATGEPAGSRGRRSLNSAEKSDG